MSLERFFIRDRIASYLHLRDVRQTGRASLREIALASPTSSRRDEEPTAPEKKQGKAERHETNQKMKRYETTYSKAF